MSVHIYCDQMELVLMVLRGKKWTNLSVAYDKVRRIQFVRAEKSISLLSLFRDGGEKIIIEVAGQEPLIYKQSKEKKHWADYKRELSAFAKRNRVTFSDNTATPQNGVAAT